MEKNFNLSVANIIKEGNNLTFYLNQPNKKGWGVVYARLRIGERLVRISTSVKVKADFWNVREGRVIIPRGATDLEVGLHMIGEKNLAMVRDCVETKFFEYLCSVNSPVGVEFMADDIKRNLTQIITSKIMPPRILNGYSINSGRLWELCPIPRAKQLFCLLSRILSSS